MTRLSAFSTMSAGRCGWRNGGCQSCVSGPMTCCRTREWKGCSSASIGPPAPPPARVARHLPRERGEEPPLWLPCDDEFCAKPRRGSGERIELAQSSLALTRLKRPVMLDPVTIEILWSRITSIVDEAAKVIVRTAFSTLSNEANDFASVLTDELGQSLAQNTGSIPSFIGTLPATVRHFLAEFGAADMQDGDVYITNNPWQGTGHLPDVCLVKPVFHNGRLAAFAAACSHVPDIGGMVRSVVPRQVFEEGFHIPLIRFMRTGEPDRTLIRLLRTNVRTPDQTIGDIWALVGAVELMGNRLAATLDEYGLADVRELANELFTRSEKAMRTAIRGLPE